MALHSLPKGILSLSLSLFFLGFSERTHEFFLLLCLFPLFPYSCWRFRKIFFLFWNLPLLLRLLQSSSKLCHAFLSWCRRVRQSKDFAGSVTVFGALARGYNNICCVCLTLLRAESCHPPQDFRIFSSSRLFLCIVRRECMLLNRGFIYKCCSKVKEKIVWRQLRKSRACTKC